MSFQPVSRKRDDIFWKSIWILKHQILARILGKACSNKQLEALGFDVAPRPVNQTLKDTLVSNFLPSPRC